MSDHLKRDFFKKDWEDLPDQEILSMVIDGISNKCQCQFYNVFSPPLSSLAGAVDQLLDQAVERYDRNWVTVHTAQPFHPCIYVANGSTPKKNSLPPNDKRLTTHYSWPHDEIFPLASMRQNVDGTYTAQAGDVPVIPINTGHKAFEPANPPEVKPMAKQISQNCTALEHMSTVVGEPVIYFSWDWKDYFPQFFMRMDELHRNVRVVPCTTKMANHFGIPLPQTELIQLNDTRMAFGCSPSSNYGQRIGNGLLWSWRRIFQALERESLKTARPAVIQYLRKRKRLCKPESGSSLKQNVRAEAVVFTDDPKIGACGYTAYKNAVLAFAILMDATGLLVSGLNKMQAGMAVNYTGAWYFAGIGLIVASREKRLRAIAGLQEIFNYKCSYGDYRKLVGLLNFLQFLEHNNEDLMLSTSGALNLYAPLCRPGNQTATKVTPKAYPDLVGSWLLWCDVAATRNGVPFSHAIKQSDKPDPSAEYIHIYGDAFKDDSGAGIGTFMHGYYSNLMLATELSIPILEAVAPLVGLITFQNLLPNRMDQWHVWLHADGSAIAHVMQNHKPTSPLMRFVWKTMKNHSAFKKLADNMVVDHTFGEANPVGDAPSRNNIGELTELCQAMNVKAQRIPMPPDAIEFVARVEAFNSTLASSRKPAAGTKRTLSDRERGNTPANPSFQSPFAHAMPALEAIAAPLSNKEGRAIHRQGVMGEKLAVCVDKFRVTAHNVSSRISTIIQRARDEQWNTAGLRYATYEANLQLRKALTKHDNDVSELRTLGWRDAASPTCLLCSFNGCIYGHPHSNVNTTSDGDDGGPYAHAARLPTRSPPPKAAEGAGMLALSSPAPRAERAPNARTTDTAEQAANKRHKCENQVVPSTTARGSAIPTRSPTLSPAKPPPISPINIATGQSHETATPPLQLGAQNLSELYSLLDPLPGGRGQRAWNAVMEQHADLLDDVRNDNVKAHRRCAMSEWKAYLRFLNLKDWVRPDIRSLPERRAFAERLLLAGFIPWGYARMKPGSGREKANPRSMMAKARHVVAEHRDTYHVQMADTKAATTVLTAMLRRHVANFGPLPKSRKQAFENATLKKLLKVPTQTLPSGRHWDADSYRARNVNALMRYLSQSGDRKEAVSVRRKGTYDRSKMSRASVQYLIGKQIYADPTPKQRHSMKVGDAVLVVPACTKADFTGEVWGADPIILPFDPTQFNNAAVAIINMEDKDPVTGLARKDYPLFCSEPGEPFIACQLDGLLHDLLRTFMAKDEARKYSFHSFRSYLACCLKTAGASIAEIKRICRWLDDDSLRVYCRMEVESTTALLSKAGKVEPSTLTTAQLDKLVDRPNPHMTLGELVGTNTKWLNAAAASAEHVTHRTRKNLQDNLPPLDNHDDMMALTQEFGTADNIPAGFEAYIDLTLENICTPEQYGLSGSEMGISHTRGRA